MHGVILAGGQATRMGGGDKPLRRLGRGCLLDHVVTRLAPQIAAMAISANGEAGRFAAWALPIVADRVPGCGPLGGMLAGLRWAATAGAVRLLVVPGDTPFLPSDLAVRLGEAGARIALAASGGRDHPAVALLATDLADDLDAALGAGTRSIRHFMSEYEPVRVEWPVEAGDPFTNVNTPAELAEAEARQGQGLCPWPCLRTSPP